MTEILIFRPSETFIELVKERKLILGILLRNKGNYLNYNVFIWKALNIIQFLWNALGILRMKIGIILVSPSPGGWKLMKGSI